MTGGGVTTPETAVDKVNDQFFQWTRDEANEQILDQTRTGIRKRQLEEKKLAKEQLLAGKSPSFREQFQSLQEEEDPSVWKTAAEIVALEAAEVVKGRKTATIVLYGHEKVGKTAIADQLIDRCVSALRLTINTAARQHEMKLESEQKERERRAKEEELRRLNESKDRRESVVAVKPVGLVPGGKVAGNAMAAARGIAGSSPPGSSSGSRKAAPAVGPPASRRSTGKRVSLVKRQSLLGDTNNYLPPPVLEKVSLPTPKARGPSLTDSDLPSPVSTGNRLAPISPASSPRHAEPAAKRLHGREATQIETRKPLPRLASAGMTELSCNGRKGMTNCLCFDGKETHINVPSLAGLGNWVRRSEIEFWILSEERKEAMTVLWCADRTAQIATLCICLNTNEEMQCEPGVLLFKLRDCNSNTFVATANEDICNDRWHHLRFTIVDSAENNFQLHVDGREARFHIHVAEAPHQFQDWNQMTVFGAELPEVSLTALREGKVERVFRGSMFDVRYWSAEESGDMTLRGSWELAPASDVAAAPDALGISDATIVNPTWEILEFPETCLYFNGAQTHVNTGPLGDFGQYLGNFKVEFWMRSSSVDDVMSVLGVTDTAHKHCTIGVELNKNGAGVFQKGTTLFTLRDSAGNELIASQNSHDLCDSRWHQVSWDVNASGNSMSVRIDCYPVTVDYHKLESPSVFAPLTQWVSLGAHNARGSLQSHFCGFLKEVKISALREDEYVCVAHWPMDEGAGGCLAMDKTGNGHNGVVYDRQSRRKCATWLLLDLPDALAGSFRSTAVNGQLHEHNMVRVSVLNVTQTTAATGLQREMVVNLVTGEEVVIEDGDFKQIPEAAYRYVSKDEEVRKCVEVHPDVADKGTRIVSLEVGDGKLHVFDLLSFCRKTRSVWDPVINEWIAPVTLMTPEDKKTQFLNKRASATERMLISLGRSPRLVRDAHVNPQELPGFQDEGTTNDLLFASLFAEEDSCLYFVHLVGNLSDVSADEQECTRWFFDAQLQSTENFAAIVIQRLLRQSVAKNRLEERRRVKEELEEQREHRKAMRQNHPELTCVRERRRALLLSTAAPADPRVPPLEHVERQCSSLETLLLRQGWEVIVLRDAPRAAVLDALRDLRRAADEEKYLIWAHFMGYSGKDVAYYKWPSPDQLCAVVSLQEDSSRQQVYGEESRCFVSLMLEEETEKEEAHEAQLAREAGKDFKRTQRRKEAEARRATLDGQRQGGWVMSTKLDATGAPQSPAQRQERRRSSKADIASRKAMQKALEEKMPLPFTPSPTPSPPEMPDSEWAPDPHTFFLAGDSPLEAGAGNTVALEDVLGVLQRPAGTVGHHMLLTAACHPLPNTPSQPWAFVLASTGEHVRWCGERVADYLQYYLEQGLAGSAATGIGRLAKSAARQEAEAALVEKYRREVKDAVQRGRRPPQKPVADRGVTWDALLLYLRGRMSKRGCAAELCEGIERPSFVGDLLLADRGMVPQDLRDAKQQQHCAVLKFFVDEAAVDPAARREAISDITTAVGLEERQWAWGSDVEHIVLWFAGRIHNVCPPHATQSNWDAYAGGLVGKGCTFEAQVRAAWDRQPAFCLHIVAADPNAAVNVATRFRGNVDLAFTPPLLPAGTSFTPHRFGLLCTTAVAGTTASLRHLFKQLIAKQLGTLPHVSFQSYRLATDDELSVVTQQNEARVAEKRRELEAKKRALTDEEQRRKTLEEKRRTLKNL